MRKPLYEHDCENCQFLGSFNGVDLYYCPRQAIDGSPTVIARFSSEGPDYASGMAFGSLHHDNMKSPLGEAYRRARAEGLEVSQ